MSSIVWGVLDKTGEVDNDQNKANPADMVRIYLNNRFRFNSEILTSEKHELKPRLVNIPVLDDNIEDNLLTSWPGNQ